MEQIPESELRIWIVCSWLAVLVLLGLGVCWMFWLPTVGKGAIFLAFWATLMPLFWEKIGVAGKMTWIAMLFLLLAVEYRAIDKDRDEFVRVEANRRKEEAKEFSEIGNTITTNVQKLLDHSDAQFSKTLERSNVIFSDVKEGLARQYGGDSFCYVIFSPETSDNNAQLWLTVQGHHHLSNVNIRFSDTDLLLSDPSNFQKSNTNFSTPFLARGTVLPLATYPIGTTDSHRYSVFMFAPNGAFTELIRARRPPKTTGWQVATLVIASYYDGRSGIVYEHIVGYSKDELERDRDWASASKLRHLVVKN